LHDAKAFSITRLCLSIKYSWKKFDVVLMGKKLYHNFYFATYFNFGNKGKCEVSESPCENALFWPNIV
jgi:hypothetical protein